MGTTIIYKEKVGVFARKPKQ